MRRIITLIAVALLVAGCSEPPVATSPPPPAIGVLVIRADVSEAARSEVIRSHVQNITSVDFCRRYVRAVRASHPELSWLASFTKSTDPGEAAANDLVTRLQARATSGGTEIRMELELEPAAESLVVLGAVGDEYINWAREQRRSALAQERKLVMLDMEETDYHVAQFNDPESTLSQMHAARVEILPLMAQMKALEVEANGLIARVVSSDEWQKSYDEVVAKVQLLRSEAAAKMGRIQELGTFLGSSSTQYRSPTAVRELKDRLDSYLERIDNELCELESSQELPVAWSQHPRKP